MLIFNREHTKIGDYISVARIMKINNDSKIIKRLLIVCSIFFSLLSVTLLTSSSASAACAAPATDRGSVTSTVSIPSTGTYRIWSRIASGSASTDNSYLLEIDGSSCYTVGDSDSMATGQWVWVDYQSGNTASKITASLSAGNHTIKMIGREEAVKLDRVVFTSDTTCVPTGTGDNCASPADTTAPIVSITAPGGGASVTGSVDLQASASDDSGTVSSVSYYIDGSATPLATKTTAPYTYTWDSATVSNGTHTIVAKAIDPAGNVGTSNTVSVSVTNGKPDLVVTSITISPTSPKVGDLVSFSATIKNQGTATTTSGASYNVSFSVDGTQVAWTGNFGSLAAGATKTLSATDGPSGSSTWTATSGTHAVAAAVDVLNQVAESNESNNSLNLSVTPGAVDPQSPVISITAPSAVTPIRGTQSFTATATDNVGVTKVEFYVDGSLKSTDTSNPYSYSWDTTTATNASHSLQTKAYDAVGNVGTSSITVTVDNAAPNTSITEPIQAAMVSGTINIGATATDNVGVTKVELYIDGILGATDTAPSYSYTWDTNSVTNGSHTLSTKAYDAAGNTYTSAPVSVTVSNSTGGTVDGDVNGDGVVDISDASILLYNYGKNLDKSGKLKQVGDLNEDGVVNIYDAAILLLNWNP